MRRWWLLGVASLLVVLQEADSRSPESRGLYCDCHTAHRRGDNIGIHCGNDQIMSGAVSSESGMSAEVPPGYRSIPGYAEVKVFASSATWESANYACRRDGAVLATPPDQAAYSALKELLQQEPGLTAAYIGLQDWNQPGTFYALDGSSVPFINWAQGEPSPALRNHHCAVVERGGEVRVSPCDQQHSFVCERLKTRKPSRDSSHTLNQTKSGDVTCRRGVTAELPFGYHYVPGYAMVKVYRSTATWESASRVCSKDGATLASPPDQAAYSAVKELLAREPGINQAFLGLHDRETPRTFVASDGQSVSFISWERGQPDTAPSSQHCTVLQRDGSVRVTSCDTERAFLCERRLRREIPAQYRWVEDAGRFISVRSDQKVYGDARRACEEDGGQLAVLDTWRRAEAVLRLLPHNHDSYLVGLTDTQHEGDFVTVDGRHLSDMEFQMWQQGEPDNDWSGLDEDCMSVQGVGFYNDVGCQWVRRFICEIQPF